MNLLDSPENIYTRSMHTLDGFSTWVEIDLQAIENNVRQTLAHTARRGAKGSAGPALMAIVKANAYGHGMLPVARAALRGGAVWLGVARVEEALELRSSALDCPILVMGYLPPAHMQLAITQGISFTVWETEQIVAASHAAESTGLQAHLHLKIDTGMSRLGAQPDQAFELARWIDAEPVLALEGVMTHFARADEADPAPTQAQARLFAQALHSLELAGLHPPWIHAANSAASIRHPDTRHNLLRLGIAMYGLHPSPETPTPAAFRPALSWKATLSQVKELPPGRGLSYGHTYITPTDKRIGTVTVGYGDGFRRTTGNQVLVRGRRVPVLGRVCMDQILIDLDEVPDCVAGEEVILIGCSTEGNSSLSAEDLAAAWGTINYEVVCGISARVPRIYLPASERQDCQPGKHQPDASPGRAAQLLTQQENT